MEPMGKLRVGFVGKRIVLLSLVALALRSCGGAVPSTPASPMGSQTERAELVVVIVLDQLPSVALTRYREVLPKDGVLWRGMDQGRYYERTRYNYAGTNTAPGHASIYTGVAPAQHGVDRNDVYSHLRGNRELRIMDDGVHPVFGLADVYASPSVLRTSTVGDRLRRQSPDSKVVSISLKGRAAVMSGGQTPSFVTWYDAKIGGFTTSSYYAPVMPQWLQAWNDAHPVKTYFGLWEAESPQLYQRLLGDDDAAGESNAKGLGTVFPHDCRVTKSPQKMFRTTPQSVEYTLDMARKLVTQYDMGRDAIPDLLALSISTTDYAGHIFGFESWEYLDVLIKADRALGVFIRELERNASVAVVITSDHGGTPLPEQQMAKGIPAGRLYAEDLVEDLEGMADAALGAGHWIAAYVQPYLYLHPDAIASSKVGALEKMIENYAAGNPKIHTIVSAETARTWLDRGTLLQRDIANSVAPNATGFFVVPAEGYIAGKRKRLGTGHGTPWNWDREVPLLGFGPGIAKGTETTVVPQARATAWIASLLQVH